MSERLIQRHDQFFKRLLDQPGAAAALLRERLPPGVAARLSDADPELLAASFVSDALQEHRSDRLYRAQLRQGPALLVHVLVEHKSTPDPDVALQLLEYQGAIIAEWRKRRDGPAPTVLSLVVYHGEAPWRVPLSLAERLTDDAELRPHLLDFRYSLVDLGHIEDAALSACAGLRVGFLALKHAGREGPTRELLLRLGRAAWALGMGDFIAVLRYILKEENAVTTALLREVIDAVAPTPKEPLMSIALEEFKREWLAEGWEKGLEKGRLEGLSQGLEKGLSQGLEKGLSQGLEKGLVAGQLGLLTRQAAKRFGPLPDTVQLKLNAATSEQLERWAERILDAASLDDWLR